MYICWSKIIIKFGLVWHKGTICIWELLMPVYRSVVSCHLVSFVSCHPEFVCLWRALLMNISYVLGKFIFKSFFFKKSCYGLVIFPGVKWWLTVHLHYLFENLAVSPWLAFSCLADTFSLGSLSVGDTSCLILAAVEMMISLFTSTISIGGSSMFTAN